MNNMLVKGPSETMETREWLDKISSVITNIEESKGSGDLNRRTSSDIITRLADLGVTRMWVSPAFGGFGVSLPTGMAVLRKLAAIDASIAWQMGVQGAIGRLSDYLDPQAANHIFGCHSGLIVGAVNPSGRAKRVDGGYILDGSWQFASGSNHADWLVCAALEIDSFDTRGQPKSRMLFVPRSEIKLVDDWHRLGLRGTGSVSFTVTNIFVPDINTVDGKDMLRPPTAMPSRGYAIGYYDFGPFTSSSTALGIAWSALALFQTYSLGRRSSQSAVSPTVAEKYGRAEALTRSAHLMLLDAAEQATENGPDGGSELSALVRLAAATAAENASRAVDIIYRLAGASGVYKTNPLERCFRDIHTAIKHITLSSTHIELVGEYRLGGELLMRR